ncbi:YHS domain-containing protein [Sinomonas atrocyanea]
MAVDPVCGMAVDPQAAAHFEHDGHYFSFCSTGCRDAFAAQPQQYAPPCTG